MKQLNAQLQERNLAVEVLKDELTAASKKEEVICEEYGGFLSVLESTAAAIERLHAICAQQSLQVRLRALSNTSVSSCFAVPVQDRLHRRALRVKY